MKLRYMYKNKVALTAFIFGFLLSGSLNAYNWQTHNVVPFPGGTLVQCHGTGVAIDNSGNPHVFVYTPVNRNLHYSYWENNSWVHVILAQAGMAMNSGPSVMIDEFDNIHLAYVSSSQNPTYGFYDGSAWLFETIDTVTPNSYWMSLTLDHDNIPHVAYTGTNVTHLRYAYKNGDEWVIQSFDNGAGQAINIVIDQLGYPHILSWYINSYYRYFDGTAWQSENPPRGESLALDHLDRPQISYYLTGGGSYSLYHTTKNSGTWESYLVDPGTQPNKIGWDSHINVDEEGILHIVYFAHNAALIKHAWGNDSNWNTQIIDHIGQWHSAIDFKLKNNHLYASYFDDWDGMVRIATTYQSEITTPEFLIAEVVNVNDLILTWEHDVTNNFFSNHSGYRVYVDNILFYSIPAGNNSYTVTGLPPGAGTIYITALYGNIESPPSNSVDFEIELVAPYNLNAEFQHSYVLCSWESPQGTNNVTAYIIYRNGDVVGQTTGTSYFNIDVPYGEYTYWVTAVYNNLYESDPSNEAFIIIAGTVAAPTFYPPPGIYESPIDITLNCTISDAIIYYTTDGSNPDEASPVYTEPIVLDTEKTITIKARAYREHWEPSEIAVAEYTIDYSYVEDNLSVLKTELRQNNPNPFNPETYINFTLHMTGPLSIDIYNIRGELIRRLANEIKPKGTHNILWNGKDDQGKDVSSGVYFYKMTTGNYSAMRKMILLK